MIDLNTIFEFSRTNCVAICAFLVPANVLLTLQTLICMGMCRPPSQVRNAAVVACIPAVLIILHVCTWLMIGVVMAPTYILLCLGGTCLGINVWAISAPRDLAKLAEGITNTTKTLSKVFYLN